MNQSGLVSVVKGPRGFLEVKSDGVEFVVTKWKPVRSGFGSDVVASGARHCARDRNGLHHVFGLDRFGRRHTKDAGVVGGRDDPVLEGDTPDEGHCHPREPILLSEIENSADVRIVETARQFRFSAESGDVVGKGFGRQGEDSTT